MIIYCSDAPAYVPHIKGRHRLKPLVLYERGVYGNAACAPLHRQRYVLLDAVDRSALSLSAEMGAILLGVRTIMPTPIVMVMLVEPAMRGQSYSGAATCSERAAVLAPHTLEGAAPASHTLEGAALHAHPYAHTLEGAAPVIIHRLRDEINDCSYYFDIIDAPKTFVVCEAHIESAPVAKKPSDTASMVHAGTHNSVHACVQSTAHDSAHPPPHGTTAHHHTQNNTAHDGVRSTAHDSAHPPPHGTTAHDSTQPPPHGTTAHDTTQRSTAHPVAHDGAHPPPHGTTAHDGAHPSPHGTTAHDGAHPSPHGTTAHPVAHDGAHPPPHGTTAHDGAHPSPHGTTAHDGAHPSPHGTTAHPVAHDGAHPPPHGTTAHDGAHPSPHGTTAHDTTRNYIHTASDDNTRLAPCISIAPHLAPLYQLAAHYLGPHQILTVGASYQSASVFARTMSTACDLAKQYHALQVRAHGTSSVHQEIMEYCVEQYRLSHFRTHQLRRYLQKRIHISNTIKESIYQCASYDEVCAIIR